MYELRLYEEEVRFREIEKVNRDLWLEWRHQGIGSSDAGVIMNASRFNNRDSLLASKSLPVAPEDTSNSFIKERGNKIEFQVRMFLEQKYGQSFSALNTEHTVFPFIRASLDGASEDRKTILEIKLLSSINTSKINKEAEGYKKWVAAKEQSVIPKDYYPQIQHQLFVTGADKCLFVGYMEHRGNQIVTEDKLAIVEVLPDNAYTKLLMRSEFDFWLDVQYKKDELKYKGELE